jgi:hypothetical protein
MAVDPKLSKALNRSAKKPTMMGLKVKAGPAKTSEGFQLPIIAVGNRRFYYDQKMSQIRNVSNIYEFYDLDKYEAMAIENKLFDYEQSITKSFEQGQALKKYNPPKIPQRFSDLDKQAEAIAEWMINNAKGYYEKEAQEGNFDPQNYSLADYIDDNFFDMSGDGMDGVEFLVQDYVETQLLKGDKKAYREFENEYEKYYADYYKMPLIKDIDSEKNERLRPDFNATIGNDEIDKRYRELPDIEADWYKPISKKIYDDALPKSIRKMRKPQAKLPANKVPLKNRGN